MGGGGGSASLADWEGDWSGVLEQQTNDLLATLSLGITVGADGSAQIVVDQGPLGFGRDPDPETFDISASEAQLGSPIVMFSTVYGLITATFQADGTFVFTQEVFGFDMEVNGRLDLDANEIVGFYTANLLGSFDHGGRATLCPGGCSGGPVVPPPPDCAIVPVTQGAGEACTAACTPPDGACVGAICLQVCIPGQCGDLCAAEEQCVAVEDNGAPVTFSDGRPLGGCSSDGVGPNALFETCSQGSLCEAGLRCLVFAGSEGLCASPCVDDSGCDPFNSQETGCDFAVQQQGKRYCALRCTPTEDGTTGDAECPSGMSCVASPAGGNCILL